MTFFFSFFLKNEPVKNKGQKLQKGWTPFSFFILVLKMDKNDTLWPFFNGPLFRGLFKNKDHN